MKQCIIEGCERDSRTRGLCGTCYQSARNAIKAGKATWNELEAAGLALPRTSFGGGGNPTPFRKAFEAAGCPAGPPQPNNLPAGDVEGQPLPPVCQPGGTYRAEAANGSVIEGSPASDDVARGNERGVGYPAPYNVEPAEGSIYPPASSPTDQAAPPPWAK